MRNFRSTKEEKGNCLRTFAFSIFMNTSLHKPVPGEFQITQYANSTTASNLRGQILFFPRRVPIHAFCRNWMINILLMNLKVIVRA